MAYVHRGLRRRHSARRWTPEDDRLGQALLRAGFACAEVGAALGRSKQAIIHRNLRVWNVHIRRAAPWAPKEEERAKHLLRAGWSYRHVAETLNRTASAVLKKNFREWRIVNVLPRTRHSDAPRRRRYERRYHDEHMFSGNRLACLIRDGFRCQECGVYDPDDTVLNVHHRDGNGKGCARPNNDLSNLVTLCVRCHTRRHRRKEANSA
jgi:5-methylcytosine-specific restriction endonuclease McrA